MKIEVTGSQQIIDRLYKIKSNVERGAYEATTVRTQELYRDVRGLLSSAPREGIDPGGRSAGTGKQVGPSGEAVVGIRSGRLINALTTSVSNVGNKSRYSGEIGFPSNFKVTNAAKAKRYALNWPRKQAIDSQAVNVGHAPARNPSPGKRPVSDYAQDVILGTHKIAGRNVLRMALIQDIIKSATLNKFREIIKSALRSK